MPDPPPPPDLILVTTTLPTEDGARRVAETLVTERLAACAQVQGPVHSVFRWQGAVDHATEWYCHLKTTQARFPALEARVIALHPYDVPEIIALPALLAHTPYARWVSETLQD
jgi:periplasmic divalent cation tolerance protein